MRTPYTSEERKYIVSARLAGKTWEAIANHIDRKASVVRFTKDTSWFKDLTDLMKQIQEIKSDLKKEDSGLNHENTT